VVDPDLYDWMAAHCSEKVNLLEEYRLTTAAYSEAVSELAQRNDRVTEAEYERLTKRAERARLAIGWRFIFTNIIARLLIMTLH
jgi:hypothetical protein